MRKVVAIFLLLAIVTVFVSCKKDPDVVESTIGTNAPVVTTGELTTAKPEPLTYILTTNPEKKVVMIETTRFEINTTISTLENNYNDITFNGGSVEKPNVNTSVLPSVPMPSTTKPTTTKPTPTVSTTAETTTTAVTKKPVSLVINTEGFNSDEEEIILEIDNSVWSGDIKANTQNISISVNGIPLETTVPLKVISGKNPEGNQEIILDLSGKGIGSGSTVSFTIPEGFLQTSNGAQYNRSYSASASY